MLYCNSISLLSNFYLEWYYLKMETFNKISFFNEADDIDAIKLPYGNTQ